MSILVPKWPTFVPNLPTMVSKWPNQIFKWPNMIPKRPTLVPKWTTNGRGKRKGRIGRKINRRDLGGRILIYERHGHGQLDIGKLLFGRHITSVCCFN